MTRHSKQSSAFLVLGGEVCAGVNPHIVLIETTNGQLDLLRTDQLGDNWYLFCCADGITRILTPPTRQHRHKRQSLQRVRTPAIRAKRNLLTLYGSP